MPNTEVQILTKNCIDGYSTLTSTHNGTISYLIDRDLDTKWYSINGNRDTISVKITAIFNINTTETQFVFNRLMVLNTNVKDFILEWWNGTNWIVVVDAQISGSYGCYSFGAIKSSRIRLTLKTTQQPNHEKYIGELVIARYRWTITTGISQYQVQYRQKMIQMETADGGLQTAYTRSPGNRINRYGATVTFSLLPRNEFEILRCLKDEGEPFLWYPESITTPNEIWYVHWINPLTWEYVTNYFGNGYTLVVQLQEV